MGALLGDWGKQKYGLKPVKRDALEYWPQLLAHMKDLIQEEHAKALLTDVPCAFITFRWDASAPRRVLEQSNFAL